VGIDALSEEDHLGVILNGLHLEYEQYVYLSLYLWIDIDSYVGGDLQRISKHWGCINVQANGHPGLNIRTVCVIVCKLDCSPGMVHAGGMHVATAGCKV